MIHTSIIIDYFTHCAEILNKNPDDVVEEEDDKHLANFGFLSPGIGSHADNVAVKGVWGTRVAMAMAIYEEMQCWQLK